MLEKIKLLLGFSSDDTEINEKILLLISLATARLKNLLGNIDPPEELDYILIDVVTARFNRIGSEGLTSHSIEGESLSFTDNDFDSFADDIQSFLDRQEDSTKGKVRFI